MCASRGHLVLTQTPNTHWLAQTLRVAYCDSVTTLAALERLARAWSAGFDLSSCPSFLPRLSYLAVEGVTRGSTELNTVIALYKSLNIYVDVTFATGNTS